MDQEESLEKASRRDSFGSSGMGIMSANCGKVRGLLNKKSCNYTVQQMILEGSHASEISAQKLYCPRFSSGYFAELGAWLAMQISLPDKKAPKKKWQ